MARHKLTDKTIQGARPGAADYKIVDGAGLFLLVRPTGARLWRYRYKIEGKENLFALGEYPAMSLAEARAAKDEAAALVKQGIHPAHHRQAEKKKNVEATKASKRKTENTFRRAALAWLEAGKAKWAPGTVAAKQSRLDRFLLPKIGDYPIDELTNNELLPLIKGLSTVGAWVPRLVKGDLYSVFRYAQNEEWCAAIPAFLMSFTVSVPQCQNKAVLLAPDLRKLFGLLASYRGYPETKAGLRLVLLTASRPGEVAKAEWKDIDLEAKLWRRPAEKMKAGEAHVSPLSDQAVNLLKDLRMMSRGRYLIPRRDGKQEPIGIARFSFVTRGFDIAERASPHCFRATFSTWANEKGYRPDAIEKQLAHGPRDAVRAAYDKSLLVEERRKMMQDWADYLTILEAENVIPGHFGKVA